MQTLDDAISRMERESMPLAECGCLIWMGPLSDQGYAMIKIDGRLTRLHRVAYALAKGPIPPGLVIDHKCRVRCCLNPNHLEAVLDRVNILRGVGQSAANAVKTHCPKGHALVARDYRGWRFCQDCRRESRRDYIRAYMRKYRAAGLGE